MLDSWINSRRILYLLHCVPKTDGRIRFVVLTPPSMKSYCGVFFTHKGILKHTTYIQNRFTYLNIWVCSRLTMHVAQSECWNSSCFKHFQWLSRIRPVCLFLMTQQLVRDPNKPKCPCVVGSVYFLSSLICWLFWSFREYLIWLIADDFFVIM